MTDHRPTRLVGTTLAGRYDLLALLGTGGMGEVYRARDRELDELVALKVIRDLGAPAAVERFRQEVKLARRVTHANVARTFELGHDAGVMFCTMELVEGESLAQRLARGQPMPADEAVAVACALCDGLIAAHAANVIHRDIKPANVLIAGDGRVVLADFGIAALRTGDSDGSGTPAYMAPEQARGASPTPAGDVYAVGVLLHELITGRRAFAGTVLEILDAKLRIERLVTPDVPGELASAIARATARELDDRFASAAELRRALAPWAGDRRPASSVPAPRATVPERTVIVLAPHAPADARMPLAETIHEELLAELARGRRVRVLPRVEIAEPHGATVVRFALGDTLAMTVHQPGEARAAVTLQLPLAIVDVPRAVALAATAIDTVLGTPPRPPGRIAEACELLVRARHIARREPGALELPLALLERANELNPDDPHIHAGLAIVLIREAFFTPEIDAELLGRAKGYVRAALERGPEIAEAHLAAGHLELHTGEAALAAAHYRTAIARAPYSADAHEYLGRMLLEAGYLEPALARLETATAISPEFHSARWEIARALALEQRWDEHDRVLGPLDSIRGGRPIARARFQWWRGDLDGLRALRAGNVMAERFDSRLAELQLAAFLDGAWPRVRDELLQIAFDTSSPSRRRRVFIAQLVAETAGFTGDADAAMRIVAHAVDQGLFDLHWLDRCPSIAPIRALAAFAPVRGVIEGRARRIYDALYGDHSETALASG